MREESRGWTPCFISSPSSGVGWSLGQGSRTSKAGKAGNGTVTLPWLTGGCVVNSLGYQPKCWHAIFFPLSWWGDNQRVDHSSPRMYWECWPWALGTDCLGQVILLGEQSTSNPWPLEHTAWRTRGVISRVSIAHITYPGRQKAAFQNISYKATSRTEQNCWGHGRLVKVALLRRKYPKSNWFWKNVLYLLLPFPQKLVSPWLILLIHVFLCHVVLSTYVPIIIQTLGK